MITGTLTRVQTPVRWRWFCLPISSEQNAAEVHCPLKVACVWGYSNLNGAAEGAKQDEPPQLTRVSTSIRWLKSQPC